MKRFMVVVILLAVMTLAGCPQNVNVADTNDAAEAVTATTAAVAVNLSSSTVDNPFLGADNPYVDGIDIPDDMGVVVIDGNFRDSAKSSAKNLNPINWNWIVDDFIGHASKMTLNFWPKGLYGGMGKGGGGYGGGLSFEVDIEPDGHYHGELPIRGIDYDVYVETNDVGYNTLFIANSTISVVAGQSNTLALLFQLTEYFNFRFTLPAMSGVYSSGQATVTTASGESYYVSYYRNCWDCSVDSEGNVLADAVVFECYLPVDFNGSENGAELTVIDANGDMQVTKLGFDIFNVDHSGAPFTVNYVYPEDIGQVTVDIDFVEYPDPNQGKG